jgi:3-oxoacyl-[acyl-carrier-protein] synthase II
MSDPIVISGMSDIGRPPCPADGGFAHLPFDHRRDLGKKGTRNMDRLTALAISGMADLMPALGVDRETPHDGIGIVLGSAQGSMDSIVRFTYETLAHDRPDFVNPALFPNTVMNCAAGQAAIWYRLRGLNATISCHETSFLSALEYSCLQLQRGVVRTLVTGSTEELTEVSEAGHRSVARSTNRPARHAEFSMFVALETEGEARRKGRPVLAELRAVMTGFNCDPGNSAPLSGLIARALARADVDHAAVTQAVTAGTSPEQRAAELEAMRDSIGTDLRVQVTWDSYGNAGSAHNALQLSQLMECLPPGETGLLVAQERCGNMAVLVITRKEHQA